MNLSADLNHCARTRALNELCKLACLCLLFIPLFMRLQQFGHLLLHLSFILLKFFDCVI